MKAFLSLFFCFFLAASGVVSGQTLPPPPDITGTGPIVVVPSGPGYGRRVISCPTCGAVSSVNGLTGAVVGPIMGTQATTTGGNVTVAANIGEEDTSGSTILTAAATWTLPLASAEPYLGYRVYACDDAGLINGSNTITVAAASGDTITGGSTSTTAVLPVAHACGLFQSRSGGWTTLYLTGTPLTVTNSILAVDGSSSIFGISIPDLNCIYGTGSGSCYVQSLNGQAVSLAAPFTTSGANALTLTTTATTNATLPSGTVTIPGISGTITAGDCANWVTATAIGDSGAACGGGSGSLTLTDGTNTVSSVTKITVTGGTVGGTSPNATLTITGGGISCPTGFSVAGGSCVWPITASGTTSDLEWTGLTGNNYTLRCYGISSVGGTGSPSVQFGEGSTPTWETGSNYVREIIYATGTTVATPVSATSSGFAGVTANASTSNQLDSFTEQFTGLASTTSGYHTTFVSKVDFESGALYTSTESGYFNLDTNAITAIRFDDGGVDFGSTTSCTLQYDGP